MDNGWIDMRARKPTEADAIMDAGGELVVETLCRHEHGYYPVIVTLNDIEDTEDRAGPWKYYPFWRPIPQIPADLKPWHDYYRGEGERPI